MVAILVSRCVRGRVARVDVSGVFELCGFRYMTWSVSFR